MDRRYNRLEKGKGQAPPELPAKRPPVRIPANDDEDLIEANRLTIIGRELGACTLKDEKEAKIWVEVDGLNPLAMNLEIELPSGDVTEVEFEYIKIEKHCFTCFSLFHEENECPYRPLNYLPPKERNLGITQRLALQRIEAEKQRHDDRRGYRRPEAPRVPLRSAENSYTFSSRHRDRDYNRRYQSRRQDHTREQSILSRTARSNTEYHRTNTPSLQYRIVERNSTNGNYANSPAPVQNDSRLTGHEDQRASPIISIASPIPNATIDITPSRALKDRLGSPKGFCNSEKENSGSRERRSALERLSEPSPPARRTPTFEPHGKDVVDQSNGESQSSGDRIHASLRLGATGSRTGPRRGSIPVAPQSKMTTKRKVPRTPIRKRVVRSPLTGLHRRPTATRASTSTRRKLVIDKDNNIP
ncbi:hypothetical protein IGI04_036792, partial [Brassica rapa subsp. trilocularis]